MKTDAEMVPCRCGHVKWLHLETRNFPTGLCDLAGCHCRGFEAEPVVVEAQAREGGPETRSECACGAKFTYTRGIWKCPKCGSVP